MTSIGLLDLVTHARCISIGATVLMSFNQADPMAYDGQPSTRRHRPLLAHQGGWDEILLVVGPIVADRRPAVDGQAPGRPRRRASRPTPSRRRRPTDDAVLSQRSTRSMSAPTAREPADEVVVAAVDVVRRPLIVVSPSAASPATTIAAPARMSWARTGAPDSRRHAAHDGVVAVGADVGAEAHAAPRRSGSGRGRGSR